MQCGFEAVQSLPELQLNKTGNTRSYNVILNALQNLPDEEISALEQELNFYGRTGLVGIRSSRILLLLQLDTSAEAAMEENSALTSEVTNLHSLREVKPAA